MVHYARTWLTLDATSLFLPAGFDFYMASMDDSGGSSDAASNVSILRVLRVIRLIKLVRLVRASRVYERMKNKVSLSYGVQIVIQCVVTLFLGAHWYACIMALQASLHQSPQETWLGSMRYEFCEDGVPGHAEAVNSTGSQLAVNYTGSQIYGQPVPGEAAPSATGIEDCDMMDVGTYYLASFSWSIMVITGTGGTDFYPSSLSNAETLIVVTLVIFGALLWTQVQLLNDC